MYLVTDTGCFADGSLGHDYVRDRIADHLEALYRHHPRGGDGMLWGEVGPIVEALRGDMSDDAWEEYEGIDWLNRMCEEGCAFELVDGNLMLVDTSDEGVD